MKVTWIWRRVSRIVYTYIPQDRAKAGAGKQGIGRWTRRNRTEPNPPSRAARHTIVIPQTKQEKEERSKSLNWEVTS